MFDFNTVGTEPTSDYVRKPGFYSATIGEISLIKPEDTTKVPYLNVTFVTKEGKVQDKFFVSPAALWRLKKLFLAAWKKDLTQSFKSVDEIADFFISAFKAPKEVGLKVLVEPNGDRTYARLPFDDFVSLEMDKFVPRVVEPTDEDYNNFVYVRPANNNAPKTTAAIVNAGTGTADDPSESWKAVKEDEMSDLPF